MKNDGFDGVVVGEFPELGVEFVGVRDDARDIDDADLVAAASGNGNLAVQALTDAAADRPEHEPKTAMVAVMMEM